MTSTVCAKQGRYPRGATLALEKTHPRQRLSSGGSGGVMVELQWSCPAAEPTWASHVPNSDLSEGVCRVGHPLKCTIITEY